MAHVEHNEKLSREKVSRVDTNMDGDTQTFENSSKGSLQQNMTAEQLRANINAKIANPLAGLTTADLARKAESYVRDNQIGDDEDIRAFRLGAIIAQNPNKFREIKELTGEERNVLEREITHKWSQVRINGLLVLHFPFLKRILVYSYAFTSPSKTEKIYFTSSKIFQLGKS